MTTTTTSSTASLPTTNAGQMQPCTAAISMGAFLTQMEMYTQASILYTNQQQDCFNLTLTNAQNSKKQQMKAGEKQLIQGILQGVGTIANGATSVAAGVDGYRQASSNESNIENAKQFRDGAKNSSPDEVLSDETPLENGATTEEEFASTQAKETTETQKNTEENSEKSQRTEAQIKKMQEPDFDFGSEDYEEYKDSMSLATDSERAAIEKNANEYIDRQQNEQAKQSPRQLLIEGTGKMLEGAFNIAASSYNPIVAKHQGKSTVDNALTSTAQTMLGNAQSQWANVYSCITNLINVMLQTAQANKVQ